MKTYIGLVMKDPDSAYGVVFPDAPGCFSGADDLNSVFDMASEALTAWTALMRDDGLCIPPCRELADLRADRSLADLWRDTILVIAVPAPALEPENRAA